MKMKRKIIKMIDLKVQKVVERNKIEIVMMIMKVMKVNIKIKIKIYTKKRMINKMRSKKSLSGLKIKIVRYLITKKKEEM